MGNILFVHSLVEMSSKTAHHAVIFSVCRSCLVLVLVPGSGVGHK